MNRKLKHQIKLMNHTLNAIAKNQALLYFKLEELEKKVDQITGSAQPQKSGNHP